MKPGDLRLVVNSTQDLKDGQYSLAKLFDHTGRLLRSFECLTQGVNGPSYKVVGGDTVPGDYCVAYVLWTQPGEGERIWRSYGPVYLHLGNVPGQPNPQTQFGRDGEGIHGAGREKRQTKLTYTRGCVRLWNDDLVWLAKMVDQIMAKGNRLYVRVAQEPQ
ncbi:MAG: hypothetical protein AMXMBFR33_35840 [Candidatus Xenobia bacterium]